MSKNKLLRIILLLSFGIWFFCILYRTSISDSFLDGFLLIIIAFLAICVYGWSVVEDINEFLITKKRNSYLTTLIGLVLVLFNVGLFYILDSRTDAPSLLKGFYDGGFNGFMVDFKKNGNYVMANGSGLGQSYFYGTYSMQDSVIILDVSNIDNCIKTNTLLVKKSRGYNPVPNDSVPVAYNVNYIVQVDAKKRVMEYEFKFRVTEDNRNSIK